MPNQTPFAETTPNGTSEETPTLHVRTPDAGTPPALGSANALYGETSRLALVMVGLPARGKTFIARKVSRYLAWLGYRTKVFNIGNYRRMNCGATLPHQFFDPANEAANEARSRVAKIALDDMLAYFMHDRGCVAVYDATNSAHERRRKIHDECTQRGIAVMFIESICDDPQVVLRNVREVKVSSPDYVGIDPDAAAADFVQRIRHYEAAYETLDERERGMTFVKLVNVGARIVLNRVHGYLQTRVVYYLMNLHINPPPIYLSRHGESQFNQLGRIGGDSDLSERGRRFAEQLPALLAQITEDPQRLIVWTSTLKRTAQTAALLDNTKVAWKALDELDSGVCDGMTYDEIAARFPDDFRDRDLDKYSYRYKGGESYRDLVNRLEPVIMELERHNEPYPIYIVGHQAVLRAIYAFYMNYGHDELPYINIPLHTIIKLTPKAYGCDEERFSLDIPAVDTHRPRPRSVAPVPASASSPGGAGVALSDVYSPENARARGDLLVTRLVAPQRPHPASPLLVPAYPPAPLGVSVSFAPTCSTLSQSFVAEDRSPAGAPACAVTSAPLAADGADPQAMSPCSLDGPSLLVRADP